MRVWREEVRRQPGLEDVDSRAPSCTMLGLHYLPTSGFVPGGLSPSSLALWGFGGQKYSIVSIKLSRP